MPDSEWEDVPKKSGASTATADEWEDVSPEKDKEEPTEENLPGSTPRLRAAVSSGVAKMQPPTQFEKERTPEGSALWRGAKAFGSDVLGAVQGAGESLLGGQVGALASAPAQAAQMYIADQQRKQAGYSPLYRGAAALGSVAGVDPSGMEEAAAHGDTAGIAGHTVLPAIGAGMGLDSALTGGKVTGALSKVPGKVVGKTLDALGNPYTMGMGWNDLVTKGVRPRARATGWQDALQSPGVQRAVKEYHDASPINSMEDFKDAVPEIKEKLWDEKVQPALDRQGPRPVDMKPVAEKVRGAITPQMREFDPNGVKAMEDLASKLDKARTVSEASELNKYANSQLESYFSKYPTARRSALATSPDTMGWENARSAIREQLGKTLEDAGETETQSARKDYGHLTTIEKELERKVNVNDRKSSMSLPRILGLVGAVPTGGMSVVAGEIAHHLNQPDVLIRRGMNKLNPPEAPKFTPPAPFVPPAAPAQIPRIAGEQTPLNLPPENAPLFNIQQTPQAPPRAPAEAPLPPIQGEQQSLPLPPENAPLFNIQQTPKVGSREVPGAMVPPESSAASSAPIPPPGPRWTGDRGAMPGEPALFLDGETADTAKAAIVEMQDPRQPGRSTFEARLANGELLGSFGTEQEAARYAEQAVPQEGEKTLPPIGGPGREGVLGRIEPAPIGNQEPLTVGGVTFGGGQHLGKGLGIEHTISVGGRRVGSITVEPRDEGVLHVHWLGGEFGREMRQPIMDAIQEAYPETKSITYDRRRVARGASSATTEPREMNVKPMVPPKPAGKS
jgi:hypothetical protein